MMSVRVGWRSAMGPNNAVCPVVRNITGTRAFSAAGQNQSAVPSVSHLACGPAMLSRTPSTAGCSRQPGTRRAGIVERDVAHGGEAPRIASRRLLAVVDPVAFERRRHDDDTVDAGRIDH